MPEKIILLDSNSLIHRAYHALPDLKTSKGMHTGAIVGFLTILLRLIREQSPTHIAAAFDLKGPTFRHKMYSSYKATRKPMDEELFSQIEPLKEILTAMGVKIMEMEGYEADDVLGTLANRFEADTIIVTGDRDSFQLVSQSTRIFWTRKGVSDIEIYDIDRLAADGFTPASFIDYKALRGDPSDNIPGVPGIGEKTAKQLLEAYGSLDEIYARADEIKGRTGEVLRTYRDSAYMSRELATIDISVPIVCSMEDMAFSPVFSAEVKQKLQELELNSIISRMTFESGGEVQKPREVEKTVIEIGDEESLNAALKGERMALYIDNCIRFSLDGKTEYTAGCPRDLFSAGLDFDFVIDRIRKALSGDGKTVGKLICFDYKSLSKTYGIEADSFFDVMIAAHLTRGSAPIKSADAVLGSEGLDTGAAEIFVIGAELEKSLAEQQLDRLFYEIEQPLAVVLRDMENRGFPVSAQTLERLKEKYEELIDGLRERIYELAGLTFNIASPKQLGEVLFEKLGLRHGKKTKTGYSVSEDVLSAIVYEHPIVELILKWRHYSKLQSTYVLGLQPLVIEGRIHTDFKQCVTATGRLSSTNPNLQNIPVRGDEAKDVKSAFTASDGNVLVSADYSQIELRLLAHMSGDEKLIEVYRRAEDIHALTASQIFGVPMDTVTSSQRREAKAVNFGIIYGMSDFGLAENLSISKYKAKEFIERYFESYPTVKAYLERNVQESRERGYALTMLGRRRALGDLKASNYLLRSAAERMAMNTPLQGSAADIVKLAMLAVERRLSGMRSKMILQVHDELIVDASPDEKDEVIRILTEEMENAVSLSVPLTVGVSVAENWGEL